MASPAKPALGPRPEWPPPATRLAEALGSLEPLPTPPHPTHRLGRLQLAEAVRFYQNSKTPKRNLRASLFTLLATREPADIL